MTWFLYAAGQGARIEVLPEVLMRRRLHRGNFTRQTQVHSPEWLFPIVKAWRDSRRTVQDR